MNAIGPCAFHLAMLCDNVFFCGLTRDSSDAKVECFANEISF